MVCRFDTVIIIGCGKIADDILSYVADLQSHYGYKTKYIEHEVNHLSRMKAICDKRKIDFARILDKCTLAETLCAMEERTLIVSAGNNYIFPQPIIEKANVEIINFHNALLPKLPGRNATTWAIYLEEPASGATWHYVTEEIDNGLIISQRQTQLTEDIKAYELSKNIMQLAYEAFQGFFDRLLQEHISGTDLRVDAKKRKIYYSYEIPENGVCTLNMPGSQIYRLLRATDYGKNDIFPPIKMILNTNNVVKISRYKKVYREHCTEKQKWMNYEDEQCVYTWLDEVYELKLSYKK